MDRGRDPLATHNAGLPPNYHLLLEQQATLPQASFQGILLLINRGLIGLNSSSNLLNILFDAFDCETIVGSIFNPSL